MPVVLEYKAGACVSLSSLIHWDSLPTRPLTNQRCDETWRLVLRGQQDFLVGRDARRGWRCALGSIKH